MNPRKSALITEGKEENRALNVPRFHLAVEQQRQRDRQQRDDDRHGNGINDAVRENEVVTLRVEKTLR